MTSMQKILARMQRLSDSGLLSMGDVTGVDLTTSTATFIIPQQIATMTDAEFVRKVLTSDKFDWLLSVAKHKLSHGCDVAFTAKYLSTNHSVSLEDAEVVASHAAQKL